MRLRREDAAAGRVITQGPRSNRELFGGPTNRSAHRMKPIEQLCHATAECDRVCRGNHENVSGGRHAYELSSVNHELDNMSDATVMLAAIKAGDSNAVEELLDLVYDELRRLAASKLA